MIKTIQKNQCWKKREPDPQGLCEEFKPDLPVNTSIHL